jgi:threonine dehydratase
VCEGAAGCSAAAAMQLASTGKYKKIVCILSGGNIDAFLSSVILS